MALKKDFQDDIIQAKNSIFEQRTKQINLSREKEVIQEGFDHTKEDIKIIKERLQEDHKRKKKLEVDVKSITEKFKQEKLEISKELEQAKAKLKQVFKHRERVED
mmetsp:Transcript_40686/g.29957  ORF Transcript_40686/g.29957 Transcript_40686/m.29957 type:complete len:105 (+) Transcript_40686:1105-1419(+)